MRKAILVVLACVSLTGCFPAAHRHRYAGIAGQAIAAGTDAKDAYQTAETQFYNEQADRLVEHFAADGYVPGSVSMLVPEQDLKVRLDAADVLVRYGMAINKAITEPKAATSSAKSTPMPASPASASKSKGSSAAKTSTLSTVLTQANINLMAQAVSEMGRILSSEELSKNLPKTVRLADPTVQQVCALLVRDIGNPGELGLRSEVKLLYDGRLMKQNQFIRDNWGKMSAVEQRAEIGKLPTLEKEEQDAEAKLEKTAEELTDVAVTSRRLAKNGRQ